MMTPRVNLQLSEILQGLVDSGALSEGSPDYLLAQKVVRDGFETLSPTEQAHVHERLKPLLPGTLGQDAQARDAPRPPPFPPAELVSKRAG